MNRVVRTLAILALSGSLLTGTAFAKKHVTMAKVVKVGMVHGKKVVKKSIVKGYTRRNRKTGKLVHVKTYIRTSKMAGHPKKGVTTKVKTYVRHNKKTGKTTIVRSYKRKVKK